VDMAEITSSALLGSLRHVQSAGGSCQNGNTGNDPIDNDEIVSECECECVRPFLAIYTTLKALRWVCWGGGAAMFAEAPFRW